jgi:hypothetical protein
MTTCCFSFALSYAVFLLTKESVTDVLGLELPFSPPIHGAFRGYLVENTSPDVDKRIIGLAH